MASHLRLDASILLMCGIVWYYFETLTQYLSRLLKSVFNCLCCTVFSIHIMAWFSEMYKVCVLYLFVISTDPYTGYVSVHMHCQYYCAAKA